VSLATYEGGKAGGTASELLASVAKAAMLPVHGLIAAPHLLFLATLVLMLFHSPDAPVPPYDRFALGVLVFVVLLRICVLREGFHLGGARHRSAVRSAGAGIERCLDAAVQGGNLECICCQVGRAFCALCVGSAHF